MSGPGHQWSANHIVEVWETKCKINSKIENSNEKMDLESHEVWCQSLRGHFHAIWIEFAMWVAHLPSQLWWCPSQFAYSFIIPRFFLFLLRCLALNRSIFKFGAVNDWLNATAVCRAADKMNKMLKRDHVVCVFFFSCAERAKRSTIGRSDGCWHMREGVFDPLPATTSNRPTHTCHDDDGFNRDTI